MILLLVAVLIVILLLLYNSRPVKKELPRPSDNFEIVVMDNKRCYTPSGLEPFRNVISMTSFDEDQMIIMTTTNIYLVDITPAHMNTIITNCRLITEDRPFKATFYGRLFTHHECLYYYQNNILYYGYMRFGNKGVPSVKWLIYDPYINHHQISQITLQDHKIFHLRKGIFYIDDTLIRRKLDMNRTNSLIDLSTLNAYTNIHDVIQHPNNKDILIVLNKQGETYEFNVKTHMSNRLHQPGSKILSTNNRVWILVSQTDFGNGRNISIESG